MHLFQASVQFLLNVQIQTLPSPTWGGDLEQGEPLLQLGGPETERERGGGSTRMRQAPERAGVPIRPGFYLHTEPLHPDGLVGAGGHGTRVGPSHQILEVKRAALRCPDRPQSGRDGIEPWRETG